MQPASPVASTCPNCGGVLVETSGGGLGCMICLLRAGIGSEEELQQDSTHEALEGDGHFGVYEIDRREDGDLYELGRGAMGVTYRATDTTLQRKVALKIIKIDVGERSADARERFMREARAAAALRHENIATVYQFGIREETGQYFYAMELIEGETLDERVHRAGPLDSRTTTSIAQQVTSALAAAEKHGLVHRDLKPATLMLVEPDEPEVVGRDRRARRKRTAQRASSTVKIIDFGVAKALHAQTGPLSLTHERFVGTPAFASPEQFEHSALDVRSDIYSLGETLWFALTGKTPFAGRSVDEIHRAQQSNVLPIEQLKAAHVSSRLGSLLKSMLALEPASRPGTRALAARLQRCSPEARSKRRTRVALAAAAILILGASALLVFQPPRIQQNAPLSPAPDKSIAVLPFENLSRDPDNVYFADGVQDEILTRLASLADLKVINRTSVMQYKSGSARDLRKIGHQLGVARVVEGSVQRAGNRVRVNAQLIDVSTNLALWGQTYDRDLADVFAIQSEIATSIARQLQASLSAREKTAIEQAPTNDITAFELYARAKDLLASRNAKANLLEAADPRNSYMLQQIALSYRLLHRFAEQKSVLDRALAIDPNNVDIQLERAAVYFYWKADSRPLHQMVDSIRTTNPAATQDIAEYWLFYALAERDAAAARNAVIAAGENPALTDETVNFSRSFMEGVIARMTKDDAEARAAFTAARMEQQKVLQSPESYGPALCVLGLIDAGLGRKEEALREGRRAVELLPVEKDAIHGIGMVEYFAMIAAWAGDKDLACQQLAIAIRPPSPLNYGHLKLLPFWDPLRGDPRFEKIVASLAPK